MRKCKINISNQKSEVVKAIINQLKDYDRGANWKVSGSSIEGNFVSLSTTQIKYQIQCVKDRY